MKTARKLCEEWLTEAGHSGPASDSTMHSKPKRTAAAPIQTPTSLVGIPPHSLLTAGGLLRLPQVLALVGVGKSTWWRLVRDGRAPSAVKVSDRCTAWRASEIAAYIEAAGQEVQP